MQRDGHIRVLPLHIANKIAAGEVVERPASVVKELLENSIDAGAKNIKITFSQGGRKLIAVKDDGCGMTRDDALLSLERQATSKILDVTDIEEIDTLGFRGEAIPSIASVSRMTITTRRHDTDEGTCVVINAGQIAEIRAAGCPPGTLIEVRELFYNVPARRKFLRSYVTEESHIRNIFTHHALSHPSIGFTLVIDGRETHRLAPGAALSDRILDLFGRDFISNLLPINPPDNDSSIKISGYIERPNLNQPSRREQYIFINGRPASASTISYALREAYPNKQGDVKPALILFIDLPPNQVDVNVHPTKREVRFRNNTAVRQAITTAISGAINIRQPQTTNEVVEINSQPSSSTTSTATSESATALSEDAREMEKEFSATVFNKQESKIIELPKAQPIQVEFAIEKDSSATKPWQWFKFLATTSSNFILLETDSGLVTLNPKAARERIEYERLIYDKVKTNVQTLLIPDVVQLSPSDAARIRASLNVLQAMGFVLEEFGRDTFKIDAMPHGIIDSSSILSCIATDLAEPGARRTSERWREEMIAKSVARAFSGSTIAFDEKSASALVEELCACRMPYVCPRGKPIMIFTSTRELNRKFGKE